MSYQAANDSSMGIQEAPILLTPEHPDPTSTSHYDTATTTATTTKTTTTRTSAPSGPDDHPPRVFYMGGRMRSYMPFPPSHSLEINEGSVRRRAVTFQEHTELEDDRQAASDALSEKRHSTTVELSYIGQDDDKNPRPLKVSTMEKDEDTKTGLQKTEPADHDAIHVRTWTERLHGQRPDRHLFPYRSMKENMHAAKTFLRRFFFLLLIIPAWVVPYVLTKNAEHKLETSHASNTTATDAALEFAGLKFMTLAASAEEEEGPDLGKAAYWVIFVLNLLVMTHLGKAAGRALEELVPRFGASIVSVFDAMTSSSVELAVAAFALRKGLVAVVQAAMLGAILNNLLLMQGIAIMIGGFRNHQQTLKKETTQASVNILLITCIAYVIPVGLDVGLTSFYTEGQPVVTDPTLLLAQTNQIREIVDGNILSLSKIMSIILLLVYSACLLYQYHSRTFMITPETKHGGAHTVERRFTHFWFAAFAYVATMAAQIYSAKLLVHAVENLGRLHNLNDSFVGFILLPIVLIADLQEEVIAIRESFDNRLDKAVALMIGSCMQIALLVTPILVILGWIMDVPMTLRFSILEVVILAASVLIINYLISDHETNWLEGALLLAVFLMCAIAFYYYDNSHLETASGEGSTISGDGTSIISG